MGRQTGYFDWITILLLFLLGSFGLFLLLTIGRQFFTAQLSYIIVGALLLIVISRIDASILWWFAPVGYVLAVLFLALSYLGPAIRGATRWIVIAGVQLQPSELVKPLLLLAFTHFMVKYSPRKVTNLPILGLLFLIPFFLVFRQPDLGSSIVYASFWGTMLMAGGLSLGLLVVGIVVVVILLPFLWTHLQGYQQSRILTFLNPALDPKGAGYNAIQAMIAVGSGGLFGRGLGRGTQSHLRFLPEYHTDFIFATLIEELGFVGGVALLIAYVVLLFRIIAPFIRTTVQDARVYIFSFGLFAMIASQVIINVGMNMGLIPITGITLPLVSYGGSSILSITTSFGFLWAIMRGHTVAKPAVT